MAAFRFEVVHRPSEVTGTADGLPRNYRRNFNALVIGDPFTEVPDQDKCFSSCTDGIRPLQSTYNVWRSRATSCS